MSGILIKNPTIINEGLSFIGDLYIRDEIISAFGPPGQVAVPDGTKIIDATGLILIPGVIDEHVHFREPGLTHKGDIFTETRAAAAGGVTSFMDMPNTLPQTTTLKDLEEKFRIGSERSLINYSFYFGATDDNLSEIMRADPGTVCGIKLFMGSSTGNMLVDNENVLKELFRKALMPIAVHCEDETTIRRNSEKFRQKHGENVPMKFHPLIRSREACFKSSSQAVNLAKEFNTRLHILHLSTADEMKLLSAEEPPYEKRITSEVCIHHLWFDDTDYEELGSKIRWNPAIKTGFDRKALIEGLNNDLIDVIATDHAPHTAEEKSGSYFKSPSGAPMVQHSLAAMLELWQRKIFSLEKIVEKMCHNPAILFNISKRGFIREGYKADLVLIDPEHAWSVSRNNILYKCGWSPMEGVTFSSKVVKTFVNGTLVYNYGEINEDYRGQRLEFKR
ncbi:MAG TPA: dihydroorotase [Bacteroidales bacterium]|nr:dihydroorotase [Bacteroidales bacterium]